MHPTVILNTATEDEAKLFDRPEIDSIQFGLSEILTLIKKQTGVGKVNAARSTTESILKHNPACVIVAGFAGSISDLECGDIVVTSEALQHDVDVSKLDALKLRRGQIPFEKISEWLADMWLAKHTIDIAEKAGIETHLGKIITGDQFVADEEEAAALSDHFEALTVDMETAAIAQVCDHYIIPWISIRLISDRANGQSSEDYAKAAGWREERLSKGVKNLQTIIKNLIETLAREHNNGSSNANR